MTPEQLRAVQQLEDVASVPGGMFTICSIMAWEQNPLWTQVDVEVNCSSYSRVPEGIPLLDREHLIILIPPGFPFEYPYVLAGHNRWSGYPHVMRDQTLCLYQAPATEWDPSSGMHGFLSRLHEWLSAAAKGELDPLGAPLHPPVVYRLRGTDAPIIVTRIDTPAVTAVPWLGFAALEKISESRLDVSGWIPLGEGSPPPNAGVAILLSEPLPITFPGKTKDLLIELERRGFERRHVFSMLEIAALRNDDGAPLYLVLGAPMRGIQGNSRRQHLEAWRFPAEAADALRTVILTSGEPGEVGKLSEKLEAAIINWAEKQEVDWCWIYEARPEIVVRRDSGSPMEYFLGKSVALWGCGALGGSIAESLVRAGVRKIILHDNAVVKPGILVRQLFDDADIGKSKARALADRLKRVRPDVEIIPNTRDLLQHLDRDDWTDNADIIVDTTASEPVVAKVEHRRKKQSDARIPIAALAVGHQGRNGILVVAGIGHTGGPADVLRLAKLGALSRDRLSEYANEFWPKSRRKPFQPEPGCSEPTFRGSAAELGALAGNMLHRLGSILAAGQSDAVAQFISLSSADAQVADTELQWPSDHIFNDPHSGYQIRISKTTWLEIQAWIRHSSRVFGPTIETGGYLFGERDDALQVIWITSASGPPPDSEGTPDYFLCGIEGIEQIANESKNRTRGSVGLVGQWHAHPTTLPIPSLTDLKGMAQVLTESSAPSARSLMLIVGNTAEGGATAGVYDLSRTELDQLVTAGLGRAAELKAAPHVIRNGARVALALSGGGMRAIAFHLGCLRALHDRGILDQVQVISCVSGGAVIGALYAYSDESFETFDRRIMVLLRQGLVRGMASVSCRPSWLFGLISTMLTAGISAKITDLLRLLLIAVARLLDLRGHSFPKWIGLIQPPFRRRASRSDLLQTILRDELFGNKTIMTRRRNNMSVVLNACELKSGAAFRFGSDESGCWRYGRLVDNNSVTIAEAVAASAAYPVLLPALDREYAFTNNDGLVLHQRVLLTDGGIFDNLGTSCLRRGRDALYSTNVYNPTHVIACNAGAGLFSDHVVPYWWPTRMIRAFESVFRKVGDGTVANLHLSARTGEGTPFVLSYLGQLDDKLPYRPADLVPRADVISYPTDFSPMAEEDIQHITKRGEQLTRLLVNHYCPEL